MNSSCHRSATWAVIPARGGSKGLYRKCERTVGGIPILARAIQAALSAQTIDRVFVSTDDERFVVLAREHGAEVPFLRPAELAQDHSSVIDVVIDFLKTMDHRGLAEPDFLMLLQPTAPFVRGQDIDDAYACIKSGDDAAVGVCESEVIPDWLRQTDGHGWLCPIGNLEQPQHTPRQKMRPIYRLNGSIFWVRTDVLKQHRTFLPVRTRPYVMSQLRSVDIDTESDLRLANLILGELNHEADPCHC